MFFLNSKNSKTQKMKSKKYKKDKNKIFHTFYYCFFKPKFVK